MPIKDSVESRPIDRAVYAKTVMMHPEQFYFCVKCNKAVPRKAQMCWNCGTSIEATILVNIRKERWGVRRDL